MTISNSLNYIILTTTYAAVNVPYTVTVGSGGSMPITITAPPSSGQVLTFNGTNWIQLPLFTDNPSPPTKTVEKPSTDGCFCKRCRNFYDMAEPNQEDGSLICWSCRHT